MPSIIPSGALGVARRVGHSGPMTGPDETADPHHRLSCAERSCEVAAIFLVDARGWVLLQERDEHAPVAPNQWGVVGGHVEPGEDWTAALHRELEEETGLVIPDDTLHLWYDGRHTPSRKVAPRLRDHWRIWAGRADLTDDDIVLGEGRQIVFVDPARLDELELAESTAYFLPLFLASDTYRRLTDPPAH
jgi:8-oxo-dGTP diphosphatase